MFSQLFPQTTDRTPWRNALLSLVPFLFIGPVSVVVSYHPWWEPSELPWISPTLTGLTISLICFGFVIGLFNKFPRGSYPYGVMGFILLTFLAGEAIRRMPWNNHYEGYIRLLVIALVVLISWRIPALRCYYSNIRWDWTLLSYGLYACILFLLASQDHDEVPYLNALVLLPTLITIAGALAHLRLASAMQRVLVLVFSMFLGVFLWWFPVFDGMVGSWQGFLVVSGMLLAIWACLMLWILAPMVIGIVTFFRRQAPA
jgi:hypothetical protein